MKTWFKCTVKYHKEDDKGNRKKITEPYLIDAVSFSEAEARIYQELESVIKGDFHISDISKSNFEDVFHYDDADTWFKCKVTYTDIDHESQKEKKVTKFMLVSAHDVKQAYERIQDSLSTMIVPFEIPSILESPFVEVFVYEKDDIPDNLTPLSEAQANHSN